MSARTNSEDANSNAARAVTHLSLRSESQPHRTEKMDIPCEHRSAADFNNSEVECRAFDSNESKLSIAKLSATDVGWNGLWTLGVASEVDVAQELRWAESGTASVSGIFLRLPDGSASVQLFTRQTLARSLHLEEACYRLLTTAREQAERCHARYLRYLLPSREPSIPESTLVRCGFRHVADLEHHIWNSSAELLGAVGSESDVPPLHFQLCRMGEQPLLLTDGAPREESSSYVQQLLDALNEILRSSSELPAVPTASANQMLRNWMYVAGDVRILMARSGGLVDGLAVLNLPTSPARDNDLSKSSEATLEFIGVVPSQRRKYIATQLLRDCLQVSQSASEPAIDELSLFVDRENQAARDMYAKNGFLHGECFQLWLAAVGDDAIPAKAPRNSAPDS